MNTPSASQSNYQDSQSGHSSPEPTAESVGPGADSRRGGQARRRMVAPPHQTGFGGGPAHNRGPGSGVPVAEQSARGPALHREPAYHAGVRKCPTCKTYAYVTADSCPECGERLQARPRIIRCRHCRQQASSGLSICPHCARELQPAPSMAWTVGAPALLVLIFAVAIFARAGGLGSGPGELLRFDGGNLGPGNEIVVLTPIAGDSQAQAEEIVQPEVVAAAEVEPVDEIAVAPVEEAGEALAAEATDATEAGEALQALNADLPMDEDLIADAGTADASTADASTVELTEADTSGIGGLAGGDEDEQSIASNVEGAETTPSDAPAVAAAVEALASPTPVADGAQDTESMLADVIDYEVRQGDTLVVIASRHGTTVDDILTLNNMAEPDALRIRPGDLLRVTDRRVSRRLVVASAATSEPVASAPASPTPGSASSGEGDATGGSIAGDEVAVQAASASEPVQSASAQPAAQPQGNYQLAAPALRAPAQGSVLGCNAAEKLTWSPVPYMEADDSYIVHLGFVAGRAADGTERITWVIAQPRPANMTSWELEQAFCNLAPADYGREWRWWVEVAQGNSGAMESISPPSPVWGFRWE